MKISAIPAQITTVEDRIAGNLNLTQLLLLATPLFLTTIIFFLFPPVGRYELYKLIIAVILTIAPATMAIRVRDKLLLELIKIRVSYDLRAHIYVFRKLPTSIQESESESIKHYSPSNMLASQSVATLTTRDRIRGQRLMANDAYKVAFKSKAGGLIVKVSTIQ